MAAAAAAETADGGVSAVTVLPLPPRLDAVELELEAELQALDGQLREQQRGAARGMECSLSGSPSSPTWRRPPPELDADVQVATALRRAEKASTGSAKLRAAMAQASREVEQGAGGSTACRAGVYTAAAATTAPAMVGISGGRAGGQRSPSSLMASTASSRLKQRSPSSVPQATSALRAESSIGVHATVMEGGRAGALRALEALSSASSGSFSATHSFGRSMGGSSCRASLN